MSTKIETSINLGEEYTDKNSGFTGTAVCISKWEFGCLRIMLQPRVGEDGKLPSTESFDEEALIGHVSADNTPGGPRPQPTRSSVPGKR